MVLHPAGALHPSFGAAVWRWRSAVFPGYGCVTWWHGVPPFVPVSRRIGRRWLVDAGTFCYIFDDNARNQFRGTGAHSTLRIDALDQAIPKGPSHGVLPLKFVSSSDCWTAKSGARCQDASNWCDPCPCATSHTSQNSPLRQNTKRRWTTGSESQA